MFKILGTLFKVIKEDARKDIDNKLYNLLYEGQEYNDHVLLQPPEDVAKLFIKYPFILGYFFIPDQVIEITEELPLTQEAQISLRAKWEAISTEWKKQAYIGYFHPPKEFDRFAFIDLQTTLFELLFKLALDNAIQNGIITKDEATKPDIFERGHALVSGI